MKESEIEQHLKRLALQAGGRSYKWASPGVRGVPDQIVMLPGGKLCLVEIKRPGGVPTVQQCLRHKELAALGQRVEVVSCPAHAAALIASMVSA